MTGNERTVRLQGARIEVSADPEHVIGGFLETVLAPSRDHAMMARQLELGAEGYVTPSLGGALPVKDSPDDQPLEAEFAGFSELSEPWLIYEERPGAGTARIWLEGRELRRLFSEARQLRENAGKR